VIGHFSQARRPFSWWVGPADEPADLPARLAAAGLDASESELAMAADLAPAPEAVAPPKDLRIERASTPGQLREFAEVNAANWSPPDREVLHFYERAAQSCSPSASPPALLLGAPGHGRRGSRPAIGAAPRGSTTWRRGRRSAAGASGAP
jgi:hypothetical protein